jgi:hypothetical protein
MDICLRLTGKVKLSQVWLCDIGHVQQRTVSYVRRRMAKPWSMFKDKWTRWPRTCKWQQGHQRHEVEGNSILVQWFALYVISIASLSFCWNLLTLWRARTVTLLRPEWNRDMCILNPKMEQFFQPNLLHTLECLGPNRRQPSHVQLWCTHSTCASLPSYD